MARTLHNKWLIEILYMIGYNLEDYFACYEFLKDDLSNKGEVKQMLGPLFALNQEKAGQAFLRQIDLLKKMYKLIKQQIFLAEAANATSFGWKIMDYWELEKSNFHEWNEFSFKVFRKAVNFVRNKEKREGWFCFTGEEFTFCPVARIGVCRCGNKKI